MNKQIIGRKDDIFNKLGSKENNSLQEKLMKIREENNICKKGEKHLNNILDFHIKDPGNDDDYINQLKKDLNPASYKKNALEPINSNNNINIKNSVLHNNDLCYGFFNEINGNKYINNYHINLYFNVINKNIFLKNELNNIIEIESQLNKLKEIGLKSLSNTKNKNNYLLNSSINLFYNDSIKQYNKKNNLYNYKLLAKNFNQNENQISKDTKKEIAELISNPKNKNENSNKKTNAKKKQIKSLINIQLILKGKEKRTVVRLHPIPQYYSSFDISKLIDRYLHIENGKNQRIYRALYVPLSKTIGKNIGFCFVMMVEPKYVIDFYTTFNGIIFNKKKSRKPCSVIWADVQGGDFLKISDDPLRSPIIFKDLIDNK